MTAVIDRELPSSEAADLLDLVRDLVQRELAPRADKAEAAPELEVVVPPQLSIVCFRYLASDRTLDLNALNKALMERLQAEGGAFVTQAVVGDTFALRANVLHFGTTKADIEALLGAVIRIGSDLAGHQATHGAV